MENFTKKNRRQLLGLASLAVLIPLLSACGSSSSSSNNSGGGGTTATISGVAATGQAIGGGTVTAKCVSGTASGTTGADGSFTLKLDSGQTAPCILEVTKAGTPPITLYGYASTSGHTNITPISDMVLSKALGGTPATAFTNFSATQAATIDGGLATAKSYVSNQLSTAGLGAPSVDLLNGIFVVGDANDAILDALGSALAASGHTIDDLRTTAAGGTELTQLTNSSTGTITGVAATGSAISGGVVRAECVTGIASGTTAADGSFTLTLNNGATPPCMLEVITNTTPSLVLYGYAPTVGRANITTFTDMVMSRALAASPATAFANFNATYASTINTNLVAAKAYLNTQLTSASLGTPTVDPLNGVFAVGDANDTILNALGTALSTASHTIADLRTVAAAGTALTTLTSSIAPPTFTAATAYPYTGLYSSLVGNYDTSLSSCKTGVPADPTSFQPDFTKGTAATGLGFSIDINGKLTFAGTTTSNDAGSLNISNNGQKQIVFADFISGMTLRTDTTAQGLTLQTAGGTTGCIVGASTQALFKNIDPSARLKKIFGNGLSLVCGTKHVRFTTEGLISVNDSTPIPFDFATENTSTFFPSPATYLEQRFTSESGGVSKQFGVTIYMPVTLGPSPLVIGVNALTVTDASLGAVCTAGT